VTTALGIVTWAALILGAITIGLYLFGRRR